MGNSQIIAALNGELVHTLKGLSNEALKTKNEYIVKLLMTLDGHQSVENGIMANLSLSQQGQMDALRKLGTTDTAPSLKETLRTEVAKLQARDQRLRDQFFTVDSGIKDLAERLPIFVYLWNRFDVLDPNARIKQFLQASEQDQVKVMAAMLENPLAQ